MLMIEEMGKQIKQLVVVLPLIFVEVLFAAGTVSAQSICPPGQFGNLCNLDLQKNSNIVGNAVTILIVFAAILCLFFLLWGGIRWVMSGGDKGKIDQARGTIVHAIIGLVITLLAYFILNVIMYFVTGQTFTSFSIPTLY